MRADMKADMKGESKGNEIQHKKDIEIYDISLIKNNPVQAIYNSSDYNPIFNYNYWDEYYKDSNTRIEKYKELISNFASKYQNIKIKYSNYDELKNIIKERLDEIELALKNAFRECIINKKENQNIENINDIMIDGLINIAKFVDKFKINIHEIYDLAYEKIRKKYINEFEIYDIFVGAYSTLYGINNENREYYPFNLYFALFTKFIEFLDEKTIAINYNLNYIKKYANDYKKAYEILNNEKILNNNITENILFGNTFINKLLQDNDNEVDGIFLEKFYYKIEYKDNDFIRIKLPIEIIDYLFMIKKELINLNNIYKNKNNTDYLKVKELMDHITNSLLPNIYLFKIPIKLNQTSSSDIKNYIPYSLPNKLIGIYKDGDKYVFDITNLEEDDIYDLEPLLLFEHTIIHKTNSNGFVEKYKNILNLDQIYSRLVNDLDLALAFLIFDYKNTAQYVNKLLFFENYLTPLAKELLKHIYNLYKNNIKNIDAVTIVRTCKFGNNFISKIAYDIIYAKYKKIYDTKIKDNINTPENIKSLFKATINNLVFYFIDKELKNNGDVNKIAHFFKNVYFNLLEGDIEIYEPNIDEILQQNKLYKTYIPPIDEIIDGFKDGSLIVIGARPSVGKTSIALNIALNNLYHNPDYNIGFISLETSAKSLMYRALMIITKGKIGVKDPDTNKYLINKEELHKISQYYLSRLKIVDNANNLEAVLLAIKELKEKYDVKFIIIDYLQRIPIISNKGDLSNTYQGVSNAITKISELRKELNIPIIVLSQLSRDAEYKKGKLKMSYFRDSGMIENETDIAILMDKSNNDILNNQIICNIDKNRDGKTGETILEFEKPIFYFADSNINYMNIKFENNENIEIVNNSINNNKNNNHFENNEENNYDYDDLLENKFKKQCAVCNKEFYTQFENYHLCYDCRVKKNYVRKKCTKCNKYFYTNENYNICNDCLLKIKEDKKKMEKRSKELSKLPISIYYMGYFANNIYDEIIEYINNNKIKIKNIKFKNQIIEFIAKNKINLENNKEYYILFNFLDDVLYLIFNNYYGNTLENEIKKLLYKNKYFNEIKAMLKDIRADFNELFKILLIDEGNLKIVNYNYYKNNINIQQMTEKLYYELRSLLNEILSNNNDIKKIANNLIITRKKFNNLLFKLFNYYCYLYFKSNNKNKKGNYQSENYKLKNYKSKNYKPKNHQIENSQIENSQIENSQIENSQIENSQIENNYTESRHAEDSHIKDYNKENYQLNEFNNIDFENVHKDFYNNVYNYLTSFILSQQILPKIKNSEYKINAIIDNFDNQIINYLNFIEKYEHNFVKAFNFIDEFLKFNTKFLNNKKYDINELKTIINNHYEFVANAFKNLNNEEKIKLINAIYNIRFNYYYWYLNENEYNILNIEQLGRHITTFVLQTIDILYKIIENIIYKENYKIDDNEIEMLLNSYSIYFAYYLKIINLINKKLKDEIYNERKKHIINELELKKIEEKNK